SLAGGDATVTLNATMPAEARTHDEVPERRRPRVVVHEIFVELGRHAPELFEPRARDVREIVVLVVIADVPRERVHRAVVRVRLLSLAKHVVFGNVVTGDRVKAHHDEGGER